MRVLAPLIVALIMIVLDISGLLFVPGVPAFQQDWSWPVSSSQIRDFAFSTLYAWNPNGAGHSAIYPEPWLPNIIAGALCGILGARMGLVLFLGIIFGIAGFGAWRLASTYTLSNFGICASIVLFLGSPVVLNEVQAGHLYFLISYAMAPWIIYYAKRCSSARDGLVLGVIMGIAAAQQQFLVFNLILYVVAIIGQSKFSVARALVILIAFLGTTAPQWILILSHGSSSLNYFLPLIHWEKAESIPPLASVRALGYMAGYDARLLPHAARNAFWALPMLTLATLVVSKCRDKFIFIAFILLGIVFTMGLDGPLSLPLQALFSHVRPFALFRELYDFAAFTAFGYAFIPSILFANGKSQLTATQGPIVLLTIIAVAASIISASRSSIDIARAPSNVSAMLNKLSDARFSYRYLALPAGFPQAPDSHRRGGLSPTLLSIDARPSASAAYASFPEAFAAAYALGSSNMNEASLKTLSRFGIGMLVSIPGIHTDLHAVVEPGLRSITPRSPSLDRESSIQVPGGGRLVVLPYSADPGTLDSSYVGARDLRPFKASHYIDPNSLTSTPNPRNGWARTFFWTTLPRWVYAMPSGIFTLRSRESLAIPHATLVVGSADGRLAGHGCTFVLQLDENWRILRCKNNPVLMGSPPLVVSQIAQGAHFLGPVRMQGENGAVTIIENSPTFISARVVATRDSAIVLRESYNRGWSINVPMARHFIADGFANGWILPKNVDGLVQLTFKPQKLYFFAVLLSSMLVIVSVVSSVLVPVRFRRDV